MQDGHWISRCRTKWYTAIGHIALLISSNLQSCSRRGSQRGYGQWGIEVAIFIDQSHEHRVAPFDRNDLSKIDIQI